MRAAARPGCISEVMKERLSADAIEFFHMDSLSAAVLVKVDFDLQLTLMASSLYRLPGVRVGNGFEIAKARTVFRKLVHASASIEGTGSEIVVSLGRRTSNPFSKPPASPICDPPPGWTSAFPHSASSELRSAALLPADGNRGWFRPRADAEHAS